MSGKWEKPLNIYVKHWMANEINTKKIKKYRTKKLGFTFFWQP